HTATTSIYTLSLHDALPISSGRGWRACAPPPHSSPTTCLLTGPARSATSRRWTSRRTWTHTRALTFPTRRTTGPTATRRPTLGQDRKSTRLNSSHLGISYAV